MSGIQEKDAWIQSYILCALKIPGSPYSRYSTTSQNASRTLCAAGLCIRLSTPSALRSHTGLSNLSPAAMNVDRRTRCVEGEYDDEVTPERDVWRQNVVGRSAIKTLGLGKHDEAETVETHVTVGAASATHSYHDHTQTTTFSWPTSVYSMWSCSSWCDVS